MKKITTLTKAQKSQIKVYRDKWLKNGHKITRVDKTSAIEAVQTIYKTAKLPLPINFYFFASPVECLRAVDKVRVRDNLGDNLGGNLGGNLWDNLRGNLWDNLGGNLRGNLWDNLGDNLGGNLWDNLGGNLWDNLSGAYYSNWDVGWQGTYDYVLHELFASEVDTYKEFVDYCNAKQHVHYFIPFEKHVFISDYPVILKLNSKNELHCEDGPALAYSDGYSLYMLNGKAKKSLLELALESA